MSDRAPFSRELPPQPKTDAEVNAEHEPGEGFAVPEHIEPAQLPSIPEHMTHVAMSTEELEALGFDQDGNYVEDAPDPPAAREDEDDET